MFPTATRSTPAQREKKHRPRQNSSLPGTGSVTTTNFGANWFDPPNPVIKRKSTCLIARRLPIRIGDNTPVAAGGISFDYGPADALWKESVRC